MNPVHQNSVCPVSNSVRASSSDYFLTAIFKFMLGIILTFIVLPCWLTIPVPAINPFEDTSAQRSKEDLSESHSDTDFPEEDQDDSPLQPDPLLVISEAKSSSLPPVGEEDKDLQELNNNNQEHHDYDAHNVEAVKMKPNKRENFRNGDGSTDLDGLDGENIWVEDLSMG